MKKGEILVFDTHWQFLNALLGIRLGGYMKCTYPYRNVLIWLIELNGEESKSGWTNIKENETRIIEEYTGDPWKKLESHKGVPSEYEKRAIFEVTKQGFKRHYTFMGVFKLSTGSNENKRIWSLEKDSYMF